MKTAARLARRCGCVIALLIATLPFTHQAIAQRSLEKLIEPTRIALVIGNSKYAEYGSLVTLGSPCADDPAQNSDSKSVADALAGAKWEVERFCNLTTDQMRKKIRSFNRRIQLENPAFGIIYFSGHGAQVGGNNYLFGVDANVVEEEEAKIYRQNPYMRLFVDSAVSLEEAMGEVQPLWGKAVVVFVDACRSNPLLDHLTETGMRATFPAPVSELDNVVYGFATKAGSPAPDGGLGGISRYARFLSAAIRGELPDVEEVDELLSAVGTQVIIDSNRKQFTGRSGILQRPPRFCIKGCGTPEEGWKSLFDQFGKPKVSQGPAHEVKWAHADSASRQPLQRAGRMVRASLSLDAETRATAASAPAALLKSGIENLSSAPDSASLDAPPIRQVRFDILYCFGDAAAEERERKAQGMRERLLTLKGYRSPVGGFEAGPVRLVAMPLAVNQLQYRATDSVVLFNRGSPAQQQWANWLQSGLETPVRLQEMPGVASDYLQILVCDGALAAPGPTVYLQAASKEQLAKASLVSADLKKNVPAARVMKEVEVVKNPPKETEVRYFALDDEEQAVLVARSTGESLMKEVRARLVRGYESKVKGNRLIEVWIGTKERP